MAADGKHVDDQRVQKYLEMARKRLLEASRAGGPSSVVEKARRYLSDAEYHFERGDNVSALASVNYSHGLLDGSLVKTPGSRSRGGKWVTGILRKVFAHELQGTPTLTRLGSSLSGDPALLKGSVRKLEKDGLVLLQGDDLRLTPKGRSRIKVGLVAGVFDLVHPGHVAFLWWAKNKVDVLAVIVARDPNSRRRKGRSPIQSESDRLAVVSGFKPVDYACLGHEDDIYAPVLGIGPDLILLGKDQEADGRKIRSALARRGLKVRSVRSRVWDSGELSKTTKIIDRIAKDPSI
jgi:cytidyltransferase-like protein